MIRDITVEQLCELANEVSKYSTSLENLYKVKNGKVCLTQDELYIYDPLCDLNQYKELMRFISYGISNLNVSSIVLANLNEDIHNANRIGDISTLIRIAWKLYQSYNIFVEIK